MHSESAYSFIHELAAKTKGKIVSFGEQAIRCNADEAEFVKKKQEQPVVLLSEIRRAELPAAEKAMLSGGVELRTNAGKMLHRLLTEADGKVCMVSWDMSAMDVSSSH